MTRLSIVCIVLLGALCVASALTPPNHVRDTSEPILKKFPLFDYVNKMDTTWDYQDTGVRINEDKKEGPWVGHVLNMTSQTWLDKADVSRPVWVHTLVVIIPDELLYTNKSFIYITGGCTGMDAPPATQEDLVINSILATSTKSITSVLYQTPNCPIVFPADPTHTKRSEDALIAFTWIQYMANPDMPEWLAYMPMVKGVVRAMDTVQDYLYKQNIAKIQHFSVGGASKRGWTTWLTGAVDNRVIAIMPIVMDLLNMAKSLPHMYEAYGGWTFAFKDYYALNITADFGTPPMDMIYNILDPLMYKQFLTMPKLVVDATGDEFFMLDNDHFWWGQLEGETYRLMIDNAEHSMATGLPELIPGGVAFWQSILDDSPRPQFSWTMDDSFTNATGLITLTSVDKPSKVLLKSATTFDNERRDFRLVKGDTPEDPCKFIKVHIFGNACINPVFWFPEVIAPSEEKDGLYIYKATKPFPGNGLWRAFLLEMEYPGPKGTTFTFTTQVSIIPNTFPYGMPTVGDKGFLV